MAPGSGAGARAAACPTRKFERLGLRKQRYVGLRRAMWSERVRLDQDRKKKEEDEKKKEEEKRREEKETEDMMWEDQYACWLQNKGAPKGMALKKRMLDWSGCVYELVDASEEDVGDKEEEWKACTNCKHPSQTNHKFCEMCGRKLTLANEEEKDRPGDPPPPPRPPPPPPPPR